MTNTYTIHDIMEYGVVLAHDRDTDILVVANGAYFNVYAGGFTGTYTAVDAWDFRSRVEGHPDSDGDGWDGVSLIDAVDAAETLLAEHYTPQAEAECEYCDGTGDDGDGGACVQCDGAGWWEAVR